MPESGRSLTADDLLSQAGWVRQLARSLASRGVDADDIVQSAWLAAIADPPRVRVSPRAWLRSVVRHGVFRAKRREVLRKRAESEREAKENAEPADEIVARVEVHKKLAEAVLQLREPGRTTIVLRYFDGLSLVEIAHKLRVPEGTVRARHLRALDELRSRLTPERARDPKRRARHFGPFGVVFMTAKAKLGVALGVLVLVAITAGIWRVQARYEIGMGDQDPAARDQAAAAGAEAAAPSQADGAARAIVPRTYREVDLFAIAGRVRAEDGAAIAGARIVIGPLSNTESVEAASDDNPEGWPRVTRSDTSGAFRIEIRRTAPAFAVLADAPRYVPKSVTLWPEQMKGPIEIVLKDGAALSGIVRSLDSTPVPAARVAIRWFVGGLSIRREGLSNSEGRYRIEGLPWNLDPLRFLLEATAEGFASVALSRVPEADVAGTIAQDLYLPRGATIDGVVRDAETGAPIPGARVTLWILHYVTSRIGADGMQLANPDRLRPLHDFVAGPGGAFHIANVPSWGVHPAGGHSPQAVNNPFGGIAATAPGYVPAVHPLVVPDEGASLQIVLDCKKTARVRGRVVDAAGRPVANAGVSRAPDDDENENGWMPDLVFPGLPRNFATTDADGRYVLEAVPSSTRTPVLTGISAQTRGWPETAPASVTVAVSGVGEVQAPDIVLSPDFERSALVRVRSEDDAPVWGAAVMDLSGETDGSEPAWPLDRTDRDGIARLKFYEKPEGGRSYRVIVRAAGFAPATAELAPNASAAAEATLTLKAGHSLSGVVVHPDGSLPKDGRIVVADGRRPIAEVIHPAESRRSREVWPAAYSSTRVADDGSFEVRGLPEGPYHVAVRIRAGPDPAAATFSDVPSDATGLRLVVPYPEVEPQGALVVTCVDRTSRAPLVRCQVTLDSDAASEYAAATAPGTYRFTDLRPGKWRLAVLVSDFAPYFADVEIEPKAEPRRIVVELERGVILRGRLLHPEGKPFVSPMLDIRGTPQVVKLAKDGTFEIRGLKPGSRIGFVVDDRVKPDQTITYVTRKSDDLVVPTDRSEFTAEVPLAGAGWLTIYITCDRVYGKWDDEHHDLAKRSRLEIRDPEGHVVHESLGVPQNFAMVLPNGRYLLRLELAGTAPCDREITIAGGQLEVTLKPE